MRKQIIIISLTFLLAFSVTTHHALSQTLILTVFTDKLVYNCYGDTVTINGSLTLNGLPVTDGVVGIQVNLPNGTELLIRSCTTGSASGDWDIEILEIYPCDINGNVKTSFKQGEQAYFTTIIHNNRNYDLYAILSLNLYYSGITPFKIVFPRSGPVPANGNVTSRAPVIIPENALIGAATVYANVFNMLPSIGGFVYCPEKSANFTITAAAGGGSVSLTQTITQTSTDGTYNLNFKLPNPTKVGNYTVYATSRYQGSTDFKTITFQAILIGDINGDGVVDGLDLSIAARAFGSYPGHPKWDARADINGDNYIDGLDITIIARNYGKTAG